MGSGAQPELTVPGRHALEVDDVDDFAAGLGEDVEVVRGDDELLATIEARVADLDRRSRLRTALDLHERLSAPSGGAMRVLTDTDGLRLLAAQIAQAERLVSGSTERVRSHLSAQAGGGQVLAVHPETITAAAEELKAARAAVADAEAALALAEAAAPAASSGHEPIDDPWGETDDSIAAAEQFAPDADMHPRIDATRGEHLPLVLGVGVVVLLASVGAFAASLPILVLPVVVLGAFVIARGTRVKSEEHQDTHARALASDNLATVRALTDQAYGGEASRLDDAYTRRGRDDAADLAVAAASARLSSCRDRLRVADGTWRNLLGADADPADLDAIIRSRDAQADIAPELVDATPTVRAAQAFRRRLWARWNVAWAALDREPPPVDDAHSVIEALEADELFVVAVPRWQEEGSGDALREAMEAERDGLLDGTDVERARTELARAARPLVVVEAGEGAEDLLDPLLAETAVLLLSRRSDQLND
jgi:hypothetical protein